MAYRPPSNREIGLRAKLDQEAIKRPSPDLVTGENYARYRWYRFDKGLNVANRARIFSVVPSTMAKWDEQEDEEHDQPKA
jgi:hypothetical protein